MPTNPKEGKLLYHLTALDNIESIFSTQNPRTQNRNELHSTQMTYN